MKNSCNAKLDASVWNMAEHDKVLAYTERCRCGLLLYNYVCKTHMCDAHWASCLSIIFILMMFKTFRMLKMFCNKFSTLTESGIPTSSGYTHLES